MLSNTQDSIRDQGSFNNYVLDRFLPFFDHPPTPSRQTQTIQVPPTLCVRRHLGEDHPCYLHLPILFTFLGGFNSIFIKFLRKSEKCVKEYEMFCKKITTKWGKIVKISLKYRNKCLRRHQSNHPTTSRRQTQTFDLPPTHLILSTQLLNDPLL